MRPTLLRRLCARSAAVAGASSKRHVPTVRLFTGPNCSLCDELKALLALFRMVVCDVLKIVFHPFVC